MISQLVTNIPVLIGLGLYAGPDTDELALNAWRAVCPRLQGQWPESGQRRGVTIGGSGTDAGRVVSIDLTSLNLNIKGDCVLPAELGWLTALKTLNLPNNKLTSVPAELGRAVQVNLRLTPG